MRARHRPERPLVSVASVAPLDQYIARSRAAPASYEAQVACAAVLRERECHYCALYPPDDTPDGYPPRRDEDAWAPWPITPDGVAQLRALGTGETATPLVGFDLFGVKAAVTDGLGATLMGLPEHTIGSALHQQFELDLGRRPRLATTMTEQEFQRMSEAWGQLAHDARVAVEGVPYLRHCVSEQALVRRVQRELRAALKVAVLPAPLESLRHLASRFGLADDGLRAAALAGASPAARRALVTRVRAAAQVLDAFADEVGGGHCPPAVAAALCHLRLAAEECSPE